jgi:hypothetical protein
MSEKTLATYIRPPCPPTRAALIEHYARSMYVCVHPANKEIFLRNILGVCEQLRAGADPNEVQS